MHLADALSKATYSAIRLYFFFISMCVPWELNPRPFVLLTQCSTTEPQDQINIYLYIYNENSSSKKKPVCV